MTNHDGCVIDENVNLAPSFDDSLNDPVTSLFIPDILRDLDTFTSDSVDQFLGGVRIDLFLWEVDNRDLHSSLVEVEGIILSIQAETQPREK